MEITKNHHSHSSNFQSLWFTVLEEFGENHTMNFGELSPEDNHVSWTKLSHCEFDGIGGILEILNQKGFSSEVFDYQVSPIRSPNFFEKIKALIAYNPESKLRHTYFKNYDRTISGEPSRIYHYFTEQEVEVLREKAKLQKTNISLYFLSSLDSVLNEEFLTPNQERWWMLPYNMRQASQKYHKENLSSYISVQISNETSAREINIQILKKIKSFTHWAAWFWMKFLAKLGKKAVINALNHYDKNNHGWMGIYTYLNYSLKKDATIKDHLFFGVAPVTKAHPISCNLINSDERYIFCLNLHPGLKIDSDLIDEKKLEKLKTKILNKILK